MITSNAKKFRPLGTSAAIGILLGSCIATTPPAKADPPAAPSPAPAAPSAKKKIHRLIPRDKHAMSSDEALSKFKSKNVKAVAFAWDDTYIEIHNVSGSDPSEAKRILKEKSAEISDGVEPKVLWLISDESIDGFSQLESGVDDPLGKGNAPASSHKFLIETKKSKNIKAASSRNAYKYTSRTPGEVTAASDYTNWEPNGKFYAASFSSGKWNTGSS